jgi:hypothetical protein
MYNKLLVVLVSILLVGVIITEVKAETTLRLSGQECANQKSSVNLSITGNIVTSTIAVTAVKPNNIFEVKITGGLPRLNLSRGLACIETTNAFGHKTSNTNPSIHNRVVLPQAQTHAKGLAWYDSEDNVVISIPAIRFIDPPVFNGNTLISSVLRPINTLLILKITDEGFKLIEIIRSFGRIVDVGDTSARVYQDVIINEGFSFSNVQGITYVTN